MKTCGLLFTNGEFQDGESKRPSVRPSQHPSEARLPWASACSGVTFGRWRAESHQHWAQGLLLRKAVKDCRQQQIYMTISWVTFSVKMLLDHNSKHLFLKKACLGVYLIHSVGLVSGVQQRGINYTHIHIPSFLDSFPIYAITWTLFGGDILDERCRIVRFSFFVYPFPFYLPFQYVSHLSHKPYYMLELAEV